MADGKAALVGRREELTTVEEALAALADDGAGGVLEVAGDPGIGKTRLLDELRAQADSRGYLVLAGRAAEYEGELPFGVFVDAMDDHLAALDPDRLADVAGRTAPVLAVAFPALESLAAGSTPVLTEERFRTHRAVRSLLSALAEPRPLVLVLDDLHWADAGSVELLSHLLAHPPLGAVLLVAAFRPAQLSGRLDSALAHRLRLDGARRLDLAPLTRPEAHELLGPSVSGPVRDEMVEQSGGNPLFLRELARGAARAAAARPRAGGLTSHVPDSVLMVLESEIGSLSTSAQVLLQGAAVAGDPFDEDMAAIAADIGTGEALAAFDELLGAGVIRPTGTRRRFAFRHPIVRAAVYESGARTWVVRAHARLADALAKRGEPATARARHIERSATQGDERAVAALTEAGNAIASRTPADAAEWYRAALGLLPATVEAVGQRISLLIAMATALGNSGSLGESAEALNEVLDLLPTQGSARAAVVAYCAGIEQLLGRHGQARARLLDAYHGLADRDSRDGVALRIELAAAFSYEYDLQEARAWGLGGLAGSRALGDRPMEAAAAAILSFGGHGLGLPAEPELSTAENLAAALDDALLASRLDLAVYLCWALVQRERYGDAIELSERATRVSRATGQGAYLASNMTAHGWALVLTGRLTEARTVIDGAVEGLQLSPNVFLSLATSSAAMVASWAGDGEAAERLAEESIELARLYEPGAALAAVGFSLAATLVEIGQFERAKAVAFEMCGGADLTKAVANTKVIAYEALTRADLALGRPEAARRWASAAAAAVRAHDLPVESAFAARAQALVLAAGGEHGPAAELAIRAAERAGAAGSPVEAARCRIIAGRSLAQAGERDRGVALLEQAEEQLAVSGALCFRDQAEKELRRLGRRVTRRSGRLRPAEGLRALTERERELADLVARGQTNRQIAAAAFLSEKTVERHLSQIYAKLGISSRAGLAAAVAADSGPA